MSQFGQFGVPVGKTRLVTAVMLAFPIGVFLFLGSTNLHWFTLTRQIYFLFGITAGLLLGVFEARIVIPKLSQNMETIAWQIVPVGTALIGVPLLLSIAFFGTAEYTPFGLYAFFPAMPAFLATSGWYFDKFEKANKVRVFVLYWGWKYWKEPNPDVHDRFYYFVRDLASNNSSLFWSHVGYAKLFMEVLEERQDIDISVKQKLNKILRVMNRYRVIGLVGFALFMVSVLVVMVLMFGTGYSVIDWNFNETMDVLGPASGIIFVCFAVGVLALIKAYKRSVSRILATIDPEKLASI